MTGAVVALVALQALIPAYLAARKRRTRRARVFIGYYVFGVVAFVIAIPWAIWIAKDERQLEDDRPDRLDGASLRDELP